MHYMLFSPFGAIILINMVVCSTVQCNFGCLDFDHPNSSIIRTHSWLVPTIYVCMYFWEKSKFYFETMMRILYGKYIYSFVYR